MDTFDIIVIGGGVVGLTSAWKLAESGRKVLVLDRNQCGAEASSAAAGMLGAQLEVSEPGDFYQLCLESRQLYPQFAEDLFEKTGIDTGLTDNGILKLAFSTEEVDALKSQMDWQIKGGARAEFVNAVDIAHFEPVLANCAGGLFLPDDSNISAPLLARALSVAAKTSCTVKEGSEVVAIARDKSSYRVKTQSETFYAESVVIAAGAWARHLLPQALECDIQPVKGQLLAIRPQNGLSIRRTVFSNHTYLVPKRDGTIVVGATEDRTAGFDKDATIDAISDLVTAVQRIAPGLRNAVFERTWTGLRPGSSDDRPWIGEVADSPGLHVAIGHFRNGILLAPVTAQMIVASIAGEPWPHHWQTFHVSRKPALEVK
ncbi:glycine oxidase ThiO [Alicyclobacillus mengziensis]|uniref:glycine oxidase n=1 Tax=Alicyclobacillus mengziensis TaxID=2931921 RepID=A0A9X7Z6B9_9BACL|nr:glycine oxidase ThiO [Alicyclobacillus mengziensis]QSO47809.1 glycine oxidase ThiO [Alicyclobacillus mengziensis]